MRCSWRLDQLLAAHKCVETCIGHSFLLPVQLLNGDDGLGSLLDTSEVA